MFTQSMSKKFSIIISLVALIVVGTVLLIKAQPGNSAARNSMEARLQALEDREEIRQLMIGYGRTLDQRDFAGFAKLFTQDAEYGGGGSNGMTKGSEAIARLLEDVFQKNPTGVKSPNFHLFSNETIQVNGDTAVGLSKGAFVVPGDNNQPAMVMLATYRDLLVRKDRVWKFKQRIVQGDIPAAGAAPK
jgi:uncharacterized protein (TIGR02246 family)